MMQYFNMNFKLGLKSFVTKGRWPATISVLHVGMDFVQTPLLLSIKGITSSSLLYGGLNSNLIPPRGAASPIQGLVFNLGDPLPAADRFYYKLHNLMSE
jgi:hypothetical protein